MKKLIYLFLMALFALTFSSCEEEDPRSQYVGTWNYTVIGTLELYEAGRLRETRPLNSTGIATVLKFGQNDLNIGGMIFTLSGNNLTANPTSRTTSGEGRLNMVGTQVSSGHISPNLITINQTTTGTWSSPNTGASGNFSETVVFTLQR